MESIWPVFRISHQRSRYIYDLFYRRKAISRELYDFCLDQGYADKSLIAKWKKQGYERLCCLRCIQSRDTNYGVGAPTSLPLLHQAQCSVENVHRRLHQLVTTLVLPVCLLSRGLLRVCCRRCASAACPKRH